MMKPTLSIRLRLSIVGLLTGLFLTSSVMAAPTMVANIPETNVTLPWAMAGCWEHELFTVKPAAPVIQQAITLE